MKLTYALLLSSITLAAVAATAQTPVAAKPHVAPHPAAAAAPHGCAKLPVLSPKIPALPAGTPCAKTLYTITSEPPVKLENVSPLEGPELRETLGIVSSSFSLNYIDVKVGTGPLAAPHKWYTIHYTGYLTDGTKFDSSIDRGDPISIPYGQHRVIPGWDTGFDGMHVGGKRRLIIPYQLAYGPNGKPPTIPAKADLVFDVELIAQSDSEPPQKTPPPAAAPAKPAPAKAAPAASAPPAQAAPAATPPAAAPAAQPAPAAAQPPAATPPKPQ